MPLTLTENVAQARSARGTTTPVSEYVPDPTLAGACGPRTQSEPALSQAHPFTQPGAETAHAPLEGLPCPGCGQHFTPRRAQQRCCSDRCRATASRVRAAASRQAEIEELRAENARLRDLLERLRPNDPGRPA